MIKKSKVFLIISLIFLFNSLFTYKSQAEPIYVDARSYIAIDSKSKSVLIEKNSDMLIPIASTTKIMTTLVSLKYGDLDKKIEISDKASNIHGSQVGYKKGEIITLRELLYGLMLRSGNDAAIAIAEGISGSVEEFCKLMNEYAIQIGALNSHFESPHGLDSQYHYSTAYDLAIITAKAKENPIFDKIVSTIDIGTEEYGFTRSYHNINKILYQIPKANGVKTGYTGGAGKCLVTSVHEDNDDIIIVVLNSNKRWGETKKIYSYVKGNYNFKKILSKGSVVDNITYRNNKKLNLICNKDIIIPLKKGESYEVKVIKPKKLPNNIEEGVSIGKINIYINNNLFTSEVLQSDGYVINKKENIIKRVIEKYFKK